jgi:hypothetical protein
LLALFWGIRMLRSAAPKGPSDFANEPQFSVE